MKLINHNGAGRMLLLHSCKPLSKLRNRAQTLKVLLLNTSFVPPIKKSTSLFANLAISAWADAINDLMLQLGLVYPINSKLSLNMSFNFPDKPRAWLSPRMIILRFFPFSFFTFLLFSLPHLLVALLPNFISLLRNGTPLSCVSYGSYVVGFPWNFTLSISRQRLYVRWHIISIRRCNVL